MNNGNEEKTDRLDTLSNIVIGVGVFCVLLVLAAYLINFHSYDLSKSPSQWGAFGDFLGGVLNPILSFLSLILVLVTIRQQKISLQQTSKQIKMSFDEMTKSVIAQEKQADLAERQLKNLLEKNNLEDLIKVLREALEDIERNLAEEVTCFSNVGKKRKLKDQILDVVSRGRSNGVTDAFEKHHEIKIENIKSSFLYCHDLVGKLKESDGAGILYQYYVNKITLLEESSGILKYKA
ncbi:hypothetical protein ACVYFZ_12405 [Vibrio cholerae]|nr:hypothetical protein [Vibrio cholerae]